MHSESISEAVTPAATAAHLFSMSPSGARERNATTRHTADDLLDEMTREGFHILQASREVAREHGGGAR